MSFTELGIVPPIVNVLKEKGITEPFEVQAEAIPELLLGNDICCRAPTGSGKTLAFGLPLLSRCEKAQPNYPTALIVTPTRELAEQIHSVLKPLAKSIDRTVIAIYGGTSYPKQRRELDRGVDIVVACPGRLIDLMERKSIMLDDVNAVVLDEADRMADMGFIDPVCHILDNCSKNRQTILFSATLDDEVALLVKKYQQRPVKINVGPKEVSMDSMKHFFWIMRNVRKTVIAADLIEKVGRTMVFCRTRAGVDRIGRELGNERLNVATIHGGLSQAQRDRAMDRFIYGDCIALVATDVAARGIDVEGVQCVLHFDMPENGKAYKHRSGRTARAGATGVVVSLLQKSQKSKYNRIQKEVGIRYQLTDPDMRKIPENDFDYIPPQRPPRERTNNFSGRRRNRGRGRKPTSGRSDGPKRFGGRNRNPRRNDNKGKKTFPREEDRPKRNKQPSYPDRSGNKPSNDNNKDKKFGRSNKPYKGGNNSGGRPYRGGGNNSGGRPYRGGGNNSGGRPYRGGGNNSGGRPYNGGGNNSGGRPYRGGGNNSGGRPYRGGGNNSGGRPYNGGGNNSGGRPYRGGGNNSGGRPYRGGGNNSGGRPYRGGGNNSGGRPYNGGGNNSGGRPYRGGGKPAYNGGGQGKDSSKKSENKSNRNRSRKPQSYNKSNRR